MATQLTNLRVEEISGVDAPANELPGWLVMKGKNPAEVGALLKQYERVEKNQAMLYSVLVAGLEYFDDSPDEVKQAVITVLDYLEQVLTGADPDETNGAADSESEMSDETTKNATTDADEATSEESTLTKAFVSALEGIGLKRVEKSDEAATDTGADSAETDSAAETDASSATGSEGEATAENEAASEAEQAGAVEKTDTAVEKTDETATTAEVTEKSTETPISVDDIVKAFKTTLSEELDPLREAISGIADRTGNLEKRAAGRASVDGQEAVEKGSNGSSLDSAISSAANGRKVTIGA